MFDRYIYPRIEPVCQSLARPLARLGVKPDQLTVAGFIVGLACVPLLVFEFYGWALVAILANRLADGIDGPLARLTGGVSGRGAFLDVSLDFLFYAAVPLGFALASPQRNGLPAALLLFAFIGTGTTFLAMSAIAARRGLIAPQFPQKGIYYIAGLTEGFETILCFTLMCLLPQYFPLIAFCFAILCLITTFTRLLAGWTLLSGGS